MAWHFGQLGGPGNLLVVDQMELELSDLLGTQQIWGPVEVVGELSYVTDVALDRYFRVVATLQFLLHTFPEW